MQVSRAAGSFLIGGLVALSVMMLVALSSLGSIGIALALVVAALVLVLAIFGAEKTGLGVLGLAFLTAPMYKGLGGGTVTITDTCLVFGFLLLIPRLAAHRTRVPLSFSVGASLVAVTGLFAVAASGTAGKDLFTLILWCATLIVLPLGMTRLAPSTSTIERLAWAYIAGQLISFLGGVAKVGLSGRSEGLTTHPNYFGEAGLVAFALCLHLYARGRHRWLVVAASAMALSTVYLSGSRAALAATAGIIVLIPVIERSALVGYVVSSACVGVGIVVALLAPSASQNSALGRLLGKGTAAGSDTQRSQGLTEGLQRLGHHPILGQGFQNLFNIHNNYLEAAIAVGIIGFLGYIAILITLTKPLFGHDPMRRLGYVMVATIAFGATIPSLYDRTAWVPASLCAVLALGARGRPTEADEPGEGAAAPAHESVAGPRPAPTFAILR